MKVSRQFSFIAIAALLSIYANNAFATLNLFNKMSDDQLFAQASAKADSLLSLMTLDEKILMMGGVDYFFSPEIPRLGISRVMMTDATGGVHLRDNFEGKTFQKALEKSTAFPAPIALAATWNRHLANDYAKSIGEECRAAGIPVLLGPGMNIYRLSQCGRNFEYFGEDPYLSSQMISHYVAGLQSTGTIATLKHFAANNTDFFRRKSNSIVDERTLHEIYLPAFKAGIDAGAKAVMTSYNLLNGEWCGESEYVISELLRKDLGFKWMVMTDWWSVYDGKKVIRSGQNIEMPSAHSTRDIKNWIEKGDFSEKDIDKMIKPVLATFCAMNSFEIKPDSSLLKEFQKHETCAYNTAAESVVLLKNKNSILPLTTNSQNILAMGFFLDEDLKGGGSAVVDGYNHISFRKALKNEFGDNIVIEPAPYERQIREASVVILSVGTIDSEGYDRPFELPEAMEETIKRVALLNANTVVIVNSGSGIRMTDWSDKVAAILYGWYPGQNGFSAIAQILSGKINPSGKLPMTIEKKFSDNPGFEYMKNESFYTGWNGAGERAHPVYNISYDEGVLVGYRWFDTKKIEPLYPFGFGLSYTKFEMENLIVKKTDNRGELIVEMNIDIRNIGDNAGSEVVQVYVSDEKCTVLRPLKELKGFEKLFLNAGESKTVSIILTQDAFSYFSPQEYQWKLEKGKFTIHVGTSSKSLPFQSSIEL